MSETAFLDQLELQPSDDTTRLVYADWLDEHDDPRGEFLRLTVLLRTASPDAQKREEFRKRILELRPAAPSDWMPRVLFEYAQDDIREAVFRHACGSAAGRDVFLSVEGGDPSWYLLGRLWRECSQLRPASAGKDNTVRNRHGIRCSLGPIKWHDLDRCTVEFGIVTAPLMGNGTRYDVELRNAQWTITASRHAWIS